MRSPYPQGIARFGLRECDQLMSSYKELFDIEYMQYQTSLMLSQVLHKTHSCSNSFLLTCSFSWHVYGL